ncbi:hypothetical protein PVAG01_07101 [Phlyctema vagabunda]|uniref:Uncharacterized protein n=1 Tax=Phlyctema vagabunda TaxID=108571 RepID=A0ABR4PBG8_9HELO
MAISGTIQSLSAAFSFGILLQAALGALFVNWRGHGSTIFQDGRRLVLVLFLIFAALWAQIDFLNLLITPSASTTCQVGLIFTTAFDQLARVVLEQFLLWSVGNGTKLTPARIILQIILGFRVVAGGLLAGFTRPQFTPFCVAYTSLLPASIIVLALDAIIIGVLLIQALSLGLFRDMRGGQRSDKQEQSKAVVVTIFGFAFWTGLSVPMILGWENTLLILRTVLPANGLVVLVGIVIIFQGALVSARIDEAITPEAQSPFMNSLPPTTREMFNDSVNVEGSPVIGRGYTKNGLFVVNPSLTPQDSPAFQSNGDKKENYTNLRVREVDMNGGPTQTRNAPGYRGSSGIFPSAVSAPLGGSFGANQGVYAPQIRPSATAETSITAPTAQQKRSLFNRTKPLPKTSIRNLGISKPLASDAEGYSGPRMQTMDLETAAASERERRQAASARIGLVANRPAPKPPTQSAQESLRRSVSVTRKDMPESKQRSLSPIPSRDSGLSQQANGTSTSASLSPGRDEVRRRSPRSQNHEFDEKTKTKPTLQMKQVIGLPGNPRARLALSKEAAPQQQQTVMLLNDIVYDNPSVVKTIINGVPDMYASGKRPKTADSGSVFSQLGEVKSSGTIIHRPRPVKRGDSKDGIERTSFYAGPQPTHRRTKSASAVANRKSVLYSSSGSPTKLPPLPRLPPTTAADLTRLLPNDTKSMTFDEKIELLFPAPPGVTLAHNRRSSVPSLPRVPSVFMSDEYIVPNFVEEMKQPLRASKRSTISFGFQTPRLNNEEQLPVQQPRKTEEENFHLSANTYRNLVGNIGGNSFVSEIPSVEESYMEIATRKSIQSETRRSSAVLRENHRSTTSETAPSENGSHGGETTIWGSVHSPTPAIDISQARVRPTLISSESRTQSGGISKIVAGASQEDLNDGEAYVTIGLESEENRRSFLETPYSNRQSFFLDDLDFHSKEDRQPQVTISTWHRRIGDELPTFSGRRTKSRSRKMPPPTPLLLNTKGKRAAVVVREIEPSPEVSDAEEKAIQEIQAQLKKFEEESSRGSVGSLLRRLPNGASEHAEDSENDRGGRFKLLENLEREMGQQENQWQQMHNNFDRDSMSVLATPDTVAPTETNLSRTSSTGSSRPTSRGVSRRARIRSNSAVRLRGEEISSSSSDSSRASVWQQRLAEAQLEYIENAPAMLRKKSLNFLSVNKPIVSPTMPETSDTGINTDADIDIERQQAHNSLTKEIPCLWQEPYPSPKAAAGRMWNAPLETSSSRVGSAEPPAKTIRPRQRRNETSLSLLSNVMWEMPSSASRRSTVGLWRSKTARPVSIKTRPLTQRPQRKSRRATLLPDIIESPKPLPNQRDTLGIFQFPWGETSNSAVYQPTFNPAYFAVPVINMRLDARSRELEPDSPDLEEYSSSFFEDYEEEGEDDDDQYDDDSESEDDFDETTLWEIASLLNSKDVPSKESLFPPPGESMEEIDDQTDFESETEIITVAIKSSTVKFPIEPLARLPVDCIPKGLWEAPQSEESATHTGLAQPELSVWESYAPSSEGMLRSKSQYTTDILKLDSQHMWASSDLVDRSLSPSTTWGSEPKQNTAVRYLWNSTAEPEAELTEGLFNATAKRVSYRHTSLEPAAIDMLSKPRIFQTPASELITRRLWNKGNTAAYERDWISESSVRPVSPSLDSLPSSGAPSPTSETSSLKTTSTKASSIWSSVGSIGSAAASKMSFWDFKSKSSKDNIPPVPRLIPSTTDKDTSKFQAKLSARQIESKVSEGPQSTSSPVRDSKGFATRDMWEARALVLENTPIVKSWRKQSITAVQTPTTSRISTGMPKQRFTRHIATPSDWDHALVKAVSLSKPRMQRPVASSEMWEAALAEAVRMSTYTYNPSILHPVFFTESRASKLRIVHPAAIGHFIVRLERPHASPEMWKNALAKAISQGVPRVTKPVSSPADWQSALEEAINSKLAVVAPDTEMPAWMQDEIFREQQAVKFQQIKIATPSAKRVSTKPVLAQRNSLWKQTPIPSTTLPSTPSGMPLWMKDEIFKQTTQRSEMPIWMKDEMFKEQHISRFHRIKTAELPVQKRLSVKLATNEVPRLWCKSPIPSTTLPATPSGMPLWMKDEIFKEEHMSVSKQAKLPGPERLPSKPVDFPQRGLWNSSKITIAARGTSDSMPLWVKDQKPEDDKFSKALADKPLRKNSIVSRTDLPVLQSTSFWQPISTETPSPNWLEHKIKSVAQTWIAPTSTVSTNTVWAIATKSNSSNDMFAHLTHQSSTRPRSSRSGSLPTLSSSKLFQATNIADGGVNWIRISSAKRNFTWSASPVITEKAAPGALAQKALFTDAVIEPVKRAKSRKVELPLLESNELFMPIVVPEPRMDWIIISSSKGVMQPVPTSRGRSLTWTSPIKSAPQLVAGTIATSDMFTAMYLEHVRTPSVQRPYAMPLLKSNELFKPASVTEKEVNWIQASTVSKPRLSSRSLTWVASSNFSTRLPPGVLAYEEMFAGLPRTQIKKASTPRLAALPRLTSTGLFKTTPSSAETVNWIVASSTAPAVRARSQTWVAPSSSPSKAAPGAIANKEMFANMQCEQLKRPAARQVALPRLESNHLFETSAASTKDVNWIEASSSTHLRRTRAQTWVAVSRSPAKVVSGTLATKDIFTDIKAQEFKRITSRPSALPRLQSTEMFTPSPVSVREANWLEMSSQPTLKIPRTWIEPSIQSPKPTPGAVATYEMFSTMTVEPIKKAASSRLANLPELQSSELFKANTAPIPQTHWLQISSVAPVRGTW